MADTNPFAKFTPAADAWQCATCLAYNKSQDLKCVCCETPNPKPPAAAPATVTADNPFAKFTPAADSWQCATCLAYNKKDDNKCVCCETPNPKAPAALAAGSTPATTSSLPGITFGFGAAAGGGIAVSSTGGFVFGTAPSSGAVGTGNSGFGTAVGAGGILGFNFGTAAPAPAPASVPAATAALSATKLDVPNDPAPEGWPALPVFDIYKPVNGASASGVVFTFGTGDCDQLGHDDEEFEQPTPRLLKALNGAKIARIAVGGMHTLALTTTGVIWSWGCNDDAALGRSGKENAPGLVTGLDGVFVIQVACGDSHSGCLDDKGRVYTWGTYKGSGGHLGYTADTKKQETPKEMVLSGAGKVVKVSSGANHTAVLTEKGSVLAWGYSEQGQLGKSLVHLELRGNRHNGVALTPYPLKVITHDEAANPLVSPRRRRRVETCADIFCGGYCTFIKTTTGRVRVVWWECVAWMLCLPTCVFQPSWVCPVCPAALCVWPEQLRPTWCWRLREPQRASGGGGHRRRVCV